MIGALGQGKKLLRKREFDKQMERHLERVRNARPLTTDCEWPQGPPTLNHGKKYMILEDKYTEIERQNRYLLERITQSTYKRRSVADSQRMNRTLNSPFRKRLQQSIQAENGKLLKRLQQKRSNYDAQRLKEEWQKKKEVVKNISNFPYILKDGTKRYKRRATSKQEQVKKSIPTNIELSRIRSFQDVNLVITIRLDKQRMVISGDDKKGRQIKIIEIPREEALSFIQQECDGKIELIFNSISYNSKEDVLYLFAKQLHSNKITEIEEANDDSRVDHL